MGDTDREGGDVLGPGQGHNGGGEIVLRDSELTCPWAEVGKHRKVARRRRSLPSRPSRLRRPIPGGRRTTRGPGPPTRSPVGLAVHLTSPRIRRHRGQHDGPANPPDTA